MARSIIYACILVSVIYVTAGQSTSADPHCVYTFKVPTSDCGQTPGPSVDDLMWKNSVIAMQAQVKQLASDYQQLVSDNKQLASDNKQLASDNKQLASANKQLASDNKQLANDTKQLANDIRALREHNDKQDGELRNLKKDRPTSDPGRTDSEQVLLHETTINHT